MLDLKIECLRMEFHDVAGQEHRLSGIAERAAALFADRLETHLSNDESRADRHIEALSSPPVRLDLSRTSDENAARAVAQAWLDALALKLKQ